MNNDWCVFVTVQSVQSVLFDLRLHACSGVVGRERMGTAFPHKKLSENGVPTREILGDSLYYCY